MGAMVAAWLWFGCAPEAAPCVLGLPQLALVTTDYQSGLLATVDPWTGQTCDALAVLGPDPALRVADQTLAVFDRTGGSSFREYALGAYDAPVAEFAIEPGINLHDVVRVGDEWWLAPYERAEVVRWDATGGDRGVIDLSAHADADGLPEIDRFVSTERGLFVGLQRLDRDDGWAPRVGHVVLLDTQTAAPATFWEVGPNPKLYADPSNPEQVLILTGAYFEADGGIERLNADQGLTTVVTEAELGYDLSGFAGIGSHGVLLGVDFKIGGPSRYDCLNLETGEVIAGDSDPGWFVDAVAGPDRVFVVERSGWAGDARDQVIALDPQTCAATTLARGFALDPFGVVYLGG